MLICDSCGDRGKDLTVDSEGESICEECTAYWNNPRFATHGEKVLFNRINKLIERVAVLEKTTLREQM